MVDLLLQHLHAEVNQVVPALAADGRTGVTEKTGGHHDFFAVSLAVLMRAGPYGPDIVF